MVVGVMDEMVHVRVPKATADTLDTGPWMPSRLGLIFLHPASPRRPRVSPNLGPISLHHQTWKKEEGFQFQILSKQQCSLLLPVRPLRLSLLDLSLSLSSSRSDFFSLSSLTLCQPSGLIRRLCAVPGSNNLDNNHSPPMACSGGCCSIPSLTLTDTYEGCMGQAAVRSDLPVLTYRSYVRPWVTAHLEWDTRRE